MHGPTTSDTLQPVASQPPTMATSIGRCSSRENLTNIIPAASLHLQVPRVAGVGMKPDATRQRLIGYLALGATILAWVGQSEVAQAVQTAASYNKPYLIVWVNHTGMILVFIAQELYTRYQRSRTGSTAALPVVPPSPKPLPLYKSAVLAELRATEGIDASWLLWESLWLGVAYNLGDWFWYIGLPHTSVSLGTCLFNSACIVRWKSCVPPPLLRCPPAPLARPCSMCPVLSAQWLRSAPRARSDSSLRTLPSVVLSLLGGAPRRPLHRVASRGRAPGSGGGHGADTWGRG